MTRKCLCLLLAAFMANAAVITPYQTYAQPGGNGDGKTSLYIDGEPALFDTYLSDGYHYARPSDVAGALSGAPQQPVTDAARNEEDYRRLRDIARELDFGLTWDGSSKTVYIDTSAHYQENGESALSEQELQQTVYDAYVYALPLVIMDLTITNLTNVSESNGSPMNQFDHAREPANADDKFVVRPNIDTPYSSACLDLSAEPLVFLKPETDRYCSVAIYDAYTNCAAILGTGGLDNGKEAAYLLCGPDYSGVVPDGLVRVSIPTNMGWMLIRTEYIDEDDLPNVHAIQDELKLVPLSQADNPDYVPPKGSYDPANDFVPFDKIKELDIQTFFDMFNRLSASNPGTESDEPALQRFARAGIGPGLDFRLDSFSAETREILEGCPDLIIERLAEIYAEEGSRFHRIVNNWRYSADNIARFGTDYEFRAIISLVGLGANPVEMAVYPSVSVDEENKGLDGRNNYVLHFDRNGFPQCGAFWSITAYDKDGFLIHNPINKYAVRGGDNFVENPDGSVDIYIQSESPGDRLLANWLPVSEDDFQLTLRIYLPEADVLDLSWKPPYVSLNK